MHFKAVLFKEINYIFTAFNHSKLAHNINGTITVRGNTNIKITKYKTAKKLNNILNQHLHLNNY